MTFETETREEAETLAVQLRALYGRNGWAVEIVRPLFRGDTYRVNVA